MSGDENGVTACTVTALSLVAAIRSAPRSGVLRKRAGDMDLARHIVAAHPEAGQVTVQQIVFALSAADCNCDPGDGTCEDWPGRTARLRSLAEAVVAEIASPEHESDPLKAVASAERIIAERDQVIADLRDDLDDRAEQIAGLRDRCDDLFATGRAKEATITELRQEAKTSEALIETLRAELAEAAGENATLREALASPPHPEPILDLAYLEDLTARAAAMKAALERFAAPGAITATDRRKAASDALGAAQGADGEAAP